tara:strand:- start:58 stop:429 length:372 start_codon:yes stop_codon:yes gene_type:complete
MISLVGTAISVVGRLAGNWLEKKQAISEEKLKIAKAKAVAEIEWDITQAQSSQGSWKDEYWTVVLSVPMVMCFIPDLAPYVHQGFTVLKESVPEWYIAAVGAAIAAAFGYRGINKVMGAKNGK